MGIFGFLKNEDQIDDEQLKNGEPYVELSTGLDDYENPSWSQVESAVHDVVDSEDSFATLSFVNYNLEVDTIQCIKDDEYYSFEALPAKDSEEFGKIYHKESLTLEEVVELFKTFYDTQKVIGYKAFIEDHFQE
ncbi:hypothetical protein [Jeotgalicoccus sp. S0W5]|uniref:hypothetical protein n=1 Tax=Jeotgalicoccus sp. S0W5 TaxID=2527874 RepID=UPI0014152F38|nr:hypothetical protein [Jeotgalicoccus sp. S0W5]